MLRNCLNTSKHLHVSTQSNQRNSQKLVSQLNQTPLISKTVFITKSIKSLILCGSDIATLLDGGSFVHAADAAAGSLHTAAQACCSHGDCPIATFYGSEIVLPPNCEPNIIEHGTSDSD